MIYNCKDLTLERFEQAYEQHDLTALIKEGEHTEEELIIAWDKIQAEYCDLTGDDGFKELMRLRSLNMALSLKIEHVSLLCHYLLQRYNADYIDTLKGYGYDKKDRYQYDFNNPESYIKDINRILSSLGNDEQRIEDNASEIMAYIESKKGLTQGYFDESLIDIERGLKLHFSLDKTITIGKYGTYLNKLRKLK